MTRLGIAIGGAALAAGCATARVEVAHAIAPKDGPPLAVRAVGGRALEPDTKVDLVSPRGCVEVLGPICKVFPPLCIVVLPAAIGCAGVVGIVDAVLYPVQSSSERRQRSAIADISSACPVEDPAERVGAAAAAALAPEMGLRVVAAEPDPPTAATPDPTFSLLVVSERLTWSGGLRWQGRLRLLDPEGTVVLDEACDATADAGVDVYRTDCARASGRRRDRAALRRRARPRGGCGGGAERVRRAVVTRRENPSSRAAGSCRSVACSR